HFIHSDKASSFKLIQARLLLANCGAGCGAQLGHVLRVRVGWICSNKNFSKILISKRLTKIFSL
ncbi:MAG: hypothetical protein J6U57_01860, partial [Bacteroidales bacterium]|nr:hypothetical protein [Bacteroidales bacterium]